MCDELDTEEVELKFRSAGSCSTGSAWRIRLLPSHQSKLVLIHEFSHTMHSWKYWGDKDEKTGKKHQAHGPEFVGVYMYLLIRFGGIDKDAITRHANEHNIKFRLPEQYWEWEKSRGNV